MDEIIKFARYVYNPNIYNILSKNNIINILPKSKNIITKLNLYCDKYPNFRLKLRTNIWRIHPNPINILSNYLPIELWNNIDSYIIDYPYKKLLYTCKQFYINFIIGLLDYEYHTQLYVMNGTRINLSYHDFYYAKRLVNTCQKNINTINDYEETYLNEF